MEQLLSQIPIAKKLCGQQIALEGVTYRLTNHCISTTCGEGALLYHTLTGELLLLDEYKDIDSMKRYMEEVELSEELSNSVDLVKTLIESRFLIPVGYDENQYVRDVKRIAAMLQPQKDYKNNFTVLTTTDCNARCFYCYEMGARRYSMDEQTAQDVGEYIARVAKGHDVNIHWFGGEPLYNTEAIDIISRILNKKEVSFTSIMTSNGYYLTKEIARRAKRDWHVTNIQITIDGTENIYNQTKAYIDKPADPYKRVMSNISNALDEGLEITLRLNMDRENAEDLLELVDEIANRFGGRMNLNVLPMLLVEFAGKIHSFEDEDASVDAYRKLKDKLQSLDLLKKTPLSRDWQLNQCIADNDAAEVIMPDGCIQKCEHFNEDETVGSIYSDERDEIIIASWKQCSTFEECVTCPLFPRCINVRKCAWHINGCAEHVKKIRVENLKRQVMNTYLEYR